MLDEAEAEVEAEAEAADWTGAGGEECWNPQAHTQACPARMSCRHGSYVLHHSDTLAEPSFSSVRESLKERVGERGPTDPASFNAAGEGRKEVAARRKGGIRV